MRSRLLGEFDHLTFDNLNGDSRETGKRTPEGLPDPSIFSTSTNRAGIRSGTAISLLVKTGKEAAPTVKYREFWGAGKAQALENALEGTGPQYINAVPGEQNRFAFRPEYSSAEYQSWPKVVDLAGETPISGLQEMRRGRLMGLSKEDVAANMSRYLDPKVSFEQLQDAEIGPVVDGGRFNALEVRNRIINTEKFDQENILRYTLYPLDSRWAYHTNARPIWNEPRPILKRNYGNNYYFVTRSFSERPDENIVTFVTSGLPDYHLLRPNAVAIPFLWRPEVSTLDGLFVSSDPSVKANLSERARAYFMSLGASDPDNSLENASLPWHHALAIGFSKIYLEENADGIANDWPRIPLPATLAALQESAALGARVAQLLDDSNVQTASELGTIGRLKRVGDDTQGYEVRAGWGALQRGSVVMPGRGRTTQRAAEGLPAALGDQVLDVALNDAWVWSDVPVSVWEYTIGGYQVMKKWLSYREFSVLGRALTLDEAREVSRMARRLAELVLLAERLDANYERVRSDVWAWAAADPA